MQRERVSHNEFEIERSEGPGKARVYLNAFTSSMGSALWYALYVGKTVPKGLVQVSVVSEEMVLETTFFFLSFSSFYRRLHQTRTKQKR